MATKLIVPIVKIGKVKQHPNASMLSVAVVGGYQVVSGLVEDPKGEIVKTFAKGQVDEKGKRIPVSSNGTEWFIESRDGVKTPVKEVEEVRFSFQHKEGDMVVYFQADTILTDEWADKFNVKALLKTGNRVGKIALRGEPSFGLIVAVPEEMKSIWKEGDNVAEYFSAVKYEPPVKTSCGDSAAYDSEIDPFFDKFTDIQNGRIFTDVFVPGEEVVASEKVHGCLHSDTKVMMANGEEVPISTLIVGDIVLAYKGEGEFVPRKVINVIHRAPVASQKWLKLSFGERFVVCTEDHLFMTENRGWVPAKEISEKDEVVQGF
jgi:intein/homing endonuclease